MNKITLIGNLTADPEVRATPKGDTVCSFTVAVDRKHKNNGEKVTDFFRIQAWRELGDNCGKYLSKGRKAAVVGEMQARIYKDKNGEARLSLDVKAEEVEFLSPKQEQTTPPADPMDAFKDIQDDDLPF